MEGGEGIGGGGGEQGAEVLSLLLLAARPPPLSSFLYERVCVKCLECFEHMCCRVSGRGRGSRAHGRLPAPAVCSRGSSVCAAPPQTNLFHGPTIETKIGEIPKQT